MSYLVRLGTLVKRLWTWAPVEAPRPDHEFFIRADCSPCYDWHNDRAFRRQPTPLISFERPAPESDSRETPQMRHYIQERLGDRRA
jgi:hypothetical protein